MARPQEFRNDPSRATGAPLLDEIRGIIHDVLAREGLGLSQTLELLQRRAASATAEQLLRAATLVLREQQERNARLQTTIGELGDEIANLEDEVADREAEIEGLRAQLKVPA